MSRAIDRQRDTQVRIGSVTIAAASVIDARRLADALPAALERAFSGSPSRKSAASAPADQAAAQILAAIEAARGIGT